MIGPPPATSSVPAGHEERRLRIWQSPRATIDRIRRDSLLRNSLFIMSTTVVNSVFGYLFWLLAARLYPAQIVGLTAGVIAASTILFLLATLGVGGTLIQSLPEARMAARWSLTFWAGMTTAVAIGVAITAGTLVLLPLVATELAVLHSATYLMVFAVGTVAMVAGSVLDYACLAERSAGNMLARNSVVAVGKVLVMLVLTLWAGANALAMLGAWAVAAVVGVGFGFGLLVRRVSLGRPPRPSALAHHARELRTHLAGQQLIGIGGALLPYVLSLLVTVRLSSSDNAYFYTTWMMAGIFLIIAPAVSLSLFAEGANDPRDLRVKARSALVIIGAILVPGAVAILATGGILLSVFGTAYEQHAVGLLQIVVVASFPDAITNVYVAVLRVRGRLIAAAGLNLGIAVGTLGLSWALLPLLGISAVGWAFLAMQLIGCMFVVVDLLRRAPAAPTVGNVGHGERV